jgi:hypothetical protein
MRNGNVFKCFSDQESSSYAMLALVIVLRNAPTVRYPVSRSHGAPLKKQACKSEAASTPPVLAAFLSPAYFFAGCLPRSSAGRCSPVLLRSLCCPLCRSSAWSVWCFLSPVFFSLFCSCVVLVMGATSRVGPVCAPARAPA